VVAAISRPSRPCGVSNPIHVRAENLETFSRLVTLIQWTEHVCQGVQGRLEIAAKGQFGEPGSEIRDLRGGKSVRMVFRISF